LICHQVHELYVLRISISLTLVHELNGIKFMKFQFTYFVLISSRTSTVVFHEYSSKVHEHFMISFFLEIHLKKRCV